MAYSAHVKEGEKREASGDLEGAIEYYTKAIGMTAYKSESTYMLYYKRACTYQKMGEMEKAAHDFKVFLLADERQANIRTTPLGFLAGIMKASQIEGQRGTAKSCLTQQTFKKILSRYDLTDFDFKRYSNKKLYSWGQAMIGDTETPQEAAYRMGVKRLLQGKHKKAIQHLDEAIELNPEDAMSYLVRGIAHALQSRKGGLFSRSARELSKTKALSDIERAKALSKGNALIEQACIRMRALGRPARGTRPTRGSDFAAGLGSIAGFFIGVVFTFSGIMVLASSVILAKIGTNLIFGPGSLLCGVLSLFSGFSFRKRKNKKGGLLLVAGLLIFIITMTISLALE